MTEPTDLRDPLPARLEVIYVDVREAAHRLAARTRKRRRRVGIVALALVSLGALGGVARATGALDWLVPEQVRRDLRGVDRGLPADLRLDPDVEQARAVASTGTSTLYVASLPDGGYCTEIATAGRGGRGAVCTPASRVGASQIDVTVPFDPPVTPTSPVTIAGRVNHTRAASLELRYADGASDRIALVEQRFFLHEVPAARLAAAHAAPTELVARDADGNRVASAQIPAQTDDPGEEDEEARVPIYVGTKVDEDDLTIVLGIEGSVNATGAATLELRYADGATVSIRLGQGRTFDYTVPPRRRDDFRRPQTLVARDRHGDVVGRAPVAAPSFWRARERR